MKRKKRIGIYLAGVSDISGGGGVERTFSDIFNFYSNSSNSSYELYFFCDKSTLLALSSVGKLNPKHENIIVLKNISNRFKKPIENNDLFFKIVKHKIDLLHCANYGIYDFDRIYFLSKYRKLLKLKLAYTLVDCQIPYILSDENDSRNRKYNLRYVEQPRKIIFDGVLLWYKSFVNLMDEGSLKIHKPNVCVPVYSFFADISKFKPASEKENIIVFAARMDQQKKPDWFLNAIKNVVNNSPKLAKEWKFYFIGNGELSDEMSKIISDNKLEKYVERIHSGDLTTIFSKSRCFISTQDYENFTSLSMMEAMACGNAIIARNVGQSDLMVKDKENGFLLKEDSPEGLAKALEKFMSLSTDDRTLMQQKSIQLVDEVHTPKAFIAQIEDFWVNLLKKK